MPKSFFLIDDDIEDIELFIDALKLADPGVVCRSATDVREGLAYLLADPDNLPDLIFLDISMYPLDGWACLTELKKQDMLRHIPVLMYSTSSQYNDADRAINTGAYGFFTKPSDFQELIDILQTIAENLDKNLLVAFSEFNERKARKLFQY